MQEIMHSKTVQVLDPGHCASCGIPCLASDDVVVGFCSECLECSDLSGYPDGWVTLGGWD